MVLLVVMLFASVVVQALEHAPDCFQHSISAYYFSGARAVFVGTLCAIGVCLIVYRGNTNTENVLLDYSGFMAFVVAFVPTEIDNTCTATNVPTVDELSAAVTNNVWSLLGVGLVAVVLGIVGAKRYLGQLAIQQDKRALVWAIVSLLALLAVVAFFILRPDEFRENGHGVSAFALFAGIFAVTVVNAFGLRDEKGLWNRYTIVAVVMTVSAGACFWARQEGFGHWLLVMEALLIAEFAVFWCLQTWELRGRVTRKEPRPSRVNVEPPQPPEWSRPSSPRNPASQRS
jgi:FtsH-binding integral membrane protein